MPGLDTRLVKIVGFYFQGQLDLQQHARDGRCECIGCVELPLPKRFDPVAAGRAVP